MLQAFVFIFVCFLDVVFVPKFFTPCNCYPFQFNKNFWQIFLMFEYQISLPLRVKQDQKLTPYGCGLSV